jgi:phosphatidylinositol kinase/protein kinase (PI-3  family)
VPVSATVRLVSDDESSISLSEIADAHAQRLGDDPRAIAVEHRAAVAAAAGDPAQLRTAYRAACAQYPATVLRDYLLGSSLGFEEFHQLRRVFATQWAMLAFLDSVFVVGGCTPESITVSRNSGRIVRAGFSPRYAGALGEGGTPAVVSVERAESAEADGLRLTRNIATLLGPSGVRGIVPGVIAALARCFVDHGTHLRDHFQVLIRDQILSLQPRTLDADAPIPSGPDATIDNAAVIQNFDLVVARAARLAPDADSTTLGGRRQAHSAPPNLRAFRLVELAAGEDAAAGRPAGYMPWF